MPNKHFCQGPTCHEQTTNDRFLKSRGVVRGRYAYTDMNKEANGYYYFNNSDKYFCSQRCKFEWLSNNMENIEHGRPIEFIRHRRESQGYEKVTEETDWGRNYTYIKRVDNRTEVE